MKEKTQPELSSAMFITYDGLLDPLGGSQILPYLESIAAHPRRLHVLSFEKPDRFALGAVDLRRRLAESGITWTPITFTKGGKLAKARDLALMYLEAIRLQRRSRFAIVHCRSYQAAQVGRLLKRLFGVKVIFDMRGLWVDERVDGGLWDLGRLPYRFAYWFYKRVERGLLECADHVVALTYRVLPELAVLAPRMRADTSVIPCCADFGHFDVLLSDEKRSVRLDLGIPEDGFVLSYLGSLGTWYMLDEMLAFFVVAAKQREDVHLLLITRDWMPEHLERFRASGGVGLESRLHVVSASREFVPRYIGASDVMLSFIKPAYSKLASSPTKLAEAHACGVPAICNSGIGDVDVQMDELSAGALVDPHDPASVAHVIGQLDAIRSQGGAQLRDRAIRVLDLSVADSAYRKIYEMVGEL